jgi:hypothetical protein
MKSFWSEPFLWIHLAGLAVVPLCLQLVWIAVAVGDPLPWATLEIIVLAVVGIIPVLWMQLTRPFDIFSILVVAVKPQEMTESQRKILSLFKRKQQKLIACLGAIIMLAFLVIIYQFAPVAAGVTSIAANWRVLGLLVAAIAFASANLFLQVPLSVAGVLWTKEEQFNNISSIEIEQIVLSFTVPGLRVKRIFIFPSLGSAKSREI